MTTQLHHSGRPAAPARRPHRIRRAATDDAVTPDVADPVLQAATAIRWGVLILGLTMASVDDEPTWLYASATTLLVFNASWRTIRPVSVRPGSPAPQVLRAVAPDLFVALVAAVATGGWSGPYAAVALPAVLLAGYLGGAPPAVVVIAADLVALAATGLVLHGGGSARTATTVVLAAVGVVAVAAGREARRAASTLHQLSDMRLLNRLLTSMHRLTRGSSVSLDLDDVLDATCDRIRATFDVSSLVVMSYGVAGEGWRVLLTDGQLARGLDPRAAALLAAGSVERDGTLLGRGLRPLLGQSGMCQPLVAEGTVVGALLVEHQEPHRYGEQDLAALHALAAPVALAMDNARWFRRIRTVAADEERVRIARELHDGVAQALVAVHLDLGVPDVSPTDIRRIRGQVEGVLVSLRETLIDLRAGVTAATPMRLLAREGLERLERRGHLQCHLLVQEEGPHLPPRVEHEVWRILQEALANVDQHAKATTVEVQWRLGLHSASLIVVDDGVGFDLGATRHQEFGLRGMVERADAIGASITIDSEPGAGTSIALHLAR